MVRLSHLQESPAAPRKIVPETGSTSKKIGERSVNEPALGGPLAATLIVLALLAAAVVLLRRLLKKSKLLAGAGALKILGRRAITSKQEIVLVEVGSRILLLGSTRESLSTLADFARADEVALLRARCSGNEAEFKAALAESIRAAEKPEPVPAALPMDSMVDELSEIRKTVQAWKD